MELLFKRLPGATARIAQCHIQLRHSSKFSQYGNSPIPENKKKFVPDCGKYPKGFNVGSINVGIKPDSKSQPDLILVASDTPSNGAAVFTKNEFPAASITVSKDVMQKTGGSGIGTVIANSWCANTLTGKAGLEDAQAMSREAAQNMGGNISPAIVMHTGMGGQRLPIDSILQGIPKIYQTMGNSHDQWLEAARGLCTTDTFPKLGSRTFTLPSSPGVTFSIAGITKGAGMIHPNMATTLGIFCTDAPVSPAALKQSLNTAADKSYNCISIDGDTSTNDMVALLANGAAGGTEVGFDPNGTTQTKDFGSFQRTLIEFMADMAKLVVRDGEGATKFITIRVRGAPSYPAGKHIASVIARSVLFKAGIYGKDANWGNALAALGYSLADTKFANQGIIVPELTSVSFIYEGQQINFLNKGVPVEVSQETATRVMDEEDIEVLVDLRDDGQEYEEAVYWTCDLTHEFVTINGDFRT